MLPPVLLAVLLLVLHPVFLSVLYPALLAVLLKADAARIDAIVNTIGFPLVGGPAGSMEGARQQEVSRDILTRKDVPYIVAAPLLIQGAPISLSLSFFSFFHCCCICWLAEFYQHHFIISWCCHYQH